MEKIWSLEILSGAIFKRNYGGRRTVCTNSTVLLTFPTSSMKSQIGVFTTFGGNSLWRMANRLGSDFRSFSATCRRRIESSSSQSTSHGSMRGSGCYQRMRVRILYAYTHVHTLYMMLLSTQLFGDKSANWVHIRWLKFVAGLDEMGTYSWDSVALAWLYRCMCRVANRNITNMVGPLQLLQSWIFWQFSTLRPHGFDDFSFPLTSGYRSIALRVSLFVSNPGLNIHITLVSSRKEERIIQFRLALDWLGSREASCLCVIMWELYAALNVLVVVNPEILAEEHSRLWRAVTSLIYFIVIEWHQVDRVVPQLGGVQHLHGKDGRGGDRWFLTYFQTWQLHWNNRVDSVLSIQKVADPGPSMEFLDMWYRVSVADATFVDPRMEEIPNDAFHRGSSQLPARVPVQDMPDNRHVKQRRCIGT
ncbi:hypothetical protein Ahy_A08g038647 [Arachis hypogaea]|uniref:Aminotransferase-like plant mobile domain-containing protein n=1 Tax=Arachis hypogaea TaxID=3818 RepID=A0A445BU85_ARAHY|nr:hypothetical protein Ahy_A08g038647 [Arachis hypogaea]